MRQPQLYDWVLCWVGSTVYEGVFATPSDPDVVAIGKLVNDPYGEPDGSKGVAGKVTYLNLFQGILIAVDEEEGKSYTWVLGAPRPDWVQWLKFADPQNIFFS